jgi:23S rRNA (uracil1939-C5)-methyltransferase
MVAEAPGQQSRGKNSPPFSDSPPVVKNGEYEADVVGIGHNGEGVGRVGGFTLFIHGALPGERVKVKVLKVKSQYGYAKLLDVLEPSPERAEARCPIYRQCGGCQLQHLSYPAQLEWKRRFVADSLERIGKLKVRDHFGATPVTVGEPVRMEEGNAATDEEKAVVVHPTLGMPDPWRYRNKAQVPVGLHEDGLIGGFYAQGSHRIIDMDACIIQHERNDDVVRQVKRIARELGIPPYDETTGRGLLRHIVAKVGFRTGEVMVVLVTNGDTLPHQGQIIRRLRETIPGLASVCQNINTRQTNVIFGDRTRVLWGRDIIYDWIGDIRFAISARSFYQVNPVQTEVLYRKALEYAGLTGRETVIDAYCGIGTISLFLAQAARRVYGVEILPEAIDDARRNAELNGIRNVEFAFGRAEDVLPQWRRQGIQADVIVVDPPRKGCEPSLLDTIVAMRPARVVYVSCNPATLARDLRILEDGGYRAVEAQPVDMFPHTVHVECIVSTHFTG